MRVPSVVLPLALWSLAPAAPAQSSITVAGEHVYVLDRGVIFKLDAKTFEVVLSKRLPSTGAPIDDAAVEVVEVVEVPAEAEPPPARLDRAKLRGALGRGLEWLVSHQSADGRWDADEFMKLDIEGEPCDGAGGATHDVGVTGLALLALLGDGNTLRIGPHKGAVERAVKWLHEQQAEDGRLCSKASHSFIYNHAIATYALTEAYGLSKSAPLRATAQKALNYLESHRNPYAVWRYQRRDNDNDTSVTGWCLMAYCSAKDFGLQINETALQLGQSWFDSMTDPTNGRCGYTKRGERSARAPGNLATRFPPELGECMTAVALCCRAFLGVERDRITDLQADLLLATPPSADPKARDFGYWYWGTYAMHQIGGDRWRRWAAHLEAPIVERQRHEGNVAGSWDPDGVWGHEGGRVYSTALACLTLQASYRHATLVR